MSDPSAATQPSRRSARTPDTRRRPRGGGWSGRRFSSGILLKLLLLGLVNAFGVYGILSAWAVGSTAILVALVVGLIVANWVYFSKRAMPLKYIFPGLVFLLIFQVFVMGYTGYIAFTNYGFGHNSNKSDAIAALLIQNERRVEGTDTYQLTVLSQGDELAFAIADGDDVRVGTAEDALSVVDDAEVDGDRVVSVDGYDVLGFTQILERQSDVVALRVPFSDDPEDGSLRTTDGSTGYAYRSTLVYDEDADTLTDVTTNTVYTPNNKGNFVSEDGTALRPGWYVPVGFENFTKVFNDSKLVGPFVKILLWTFAFAFLSVATTFFLGLLLAIVFNDPRVKGRKIYRSLLILPYAFPAFLSALVWAGMLNKDFGFINDVLFGGASIPWLTDPWLAKLSIIGVNLWLGFPYMFIVCTGALQAIPSDIIESARMDGAGAFRIFRTMTLPLLLIAVAPLLIASFAFNFNNFNLIYFLTGGGPDFPGGSLPIGATDILITMVFAVSGIDGSRNADFGLATALSILIFLLVGAISIYSFRRTRRLEELN